MANTPRDDAAHIVFGVRWEPDAGCTVLGLKNQLDDAMLQDQIRSGHVQPIPRFTYSPFEFEGKQVGVLEVPVATDGPYTPVTNLAKLHAGAIYYRRGTQNDTAVGTEMMRILTWFQGSDVGIPNDQRTHSWRQLSHAFHHFEHGRTYFLVTDRIPPTESAPVYGLGMVPWRAVIDFDPESETSGLLSRVAAILSRHRVIHKTVRGQYQVQPEPGTHWLFARGLSGRQDTLSQGTHTAWLKSYKREIARQLDKLTGTVSPSPLTVLVLCFDTTLRRHLRTVLEEIHGAFGDAVNFVVVASGEPSLAELAESTDASFVEMTLRSLCNGLAVHFGDVGPADSRHVLVSSSGAPVEVDSDDWLWFSEEIDLVHRSAGLIGSDDARGYRLGSDLSWRNLHLHHDCDRDITLTLRTQVEADLRRRQTVRINLYHGPGSGGTTVGRRVAWDLRGTFPVGILQSCTHRETAERIAKVSALTESSVLIVVDGGQHSEREIDDLYDLLRANHLPVVLLQVLRRFQLQQTGKRQFWLDALLTDAEADRFREVYTRAAPAMARNLTALARRRDTEQRSAFFFGLTAFGREFCGLQPYVKNRIAGLTSSQRRILAYIALAQYYGQQSVPAQAFASLLGLSRSKKLDLPDVFADDAGKALELLTRSPSAEWRSAHHLVALEIMQQILAPEGSEDYRRVWRQNLSSWGKDFATFCHDDGHCISDRLLELVRRVFIYRDNIEVLGTERADQRQFSHLIEDIPSSHGRIDVLTHLTDRFPFEAHFHAHLGRLLGLSGEHNRALECIDSALALGAALLRRRFPPLFIGVFARGHSLFGAVCGGTTRWTALPPGCLRAASPT